MSGGLVFPFLLEFPTVYCDPHSQRFGMVNKAEIDVFLELSCFFDDPADVGNLISGSSAFSKTRLNVWKFSVHVLLKPGLENFKHYFTSMWDECNCVVLLVDHHKSWLLGKLASGQRSWLPVHSVGHLGTRLFCSGLWIGGASQAVESHAGLLPEPQSLSLYLLIYVHLLVSG